MTLLAHLTLAVLKRRYARESEFCALLDDQIRSGQYALERAMQRRAKWGAKILAMEKPRVLMGRLREAAGH